MTTFIQIDDYIYRAHARSTTAQKEIFTVRMRTVEPHSPCAD